MSWSSYPSTIPHWNFLHSTFNGISQILFKPVSIVDHFSSNTFSTGISPTNNTNESVLVPLLECDGATAITLRILDRIIVCKLFYWSTSLPSTNFCQTRPHINLFHADTQTLGVGPHEERLGWSRDVNLSAPIQQQWPSSELKRIFNCESSPLSCNVC